MTLHPPAHRSTHHARPRHDADCYCDECDPPVFSLRTHGLLLLALALAGLAVLVPWFF